MIQSVVSRLTVISGVALAVIAVPAVLFFSAENNSLQTQSHAATASPLSENPELVEQEPAEEPVVQIASLSIGEEKPTLEVLAIPSPLHAGTNDYIKQVSELAKQRKFEDALDVLENVHASNRNDHAVKFMEARILAWAGKYAEAEQEFENLRSQYPNDLDVLVSYAYLHFYQRNYDEAEAFFVEVLNNNPDYHDARRGLERARTANNKDNLQ